MKISILKGNPDVNNTGFDNYLKTLSDLLESRYDKYPLMSLLLEKGKDTDEGDIRIISDIYRRDAINFKTSFCLAKLTSDPVEEVANEI